MIICGLVGVIVDWKGDGRGGKEAKKKSRQDEI
jgi:hypothetical protein